jgi:hypothetical protein
MTLRARLHPRWVGGRDGYHYNVLFDGKLLIERSRDPECDAARALLGKGVTGKLHLSDAGGFSVKRKPAPWGIRYIYTSRPPMLRAIIDIETAAKLTVEETGGIPRFRKYRQRGGSEGSSRERPDAA